MESFGFQAQIKTKGRIELEYHKNHNRKSCCSSSIKIPLLKVDRTLTFEYTNDYLAVVPESLNFLKHLGNICFIRFERSAPSSAADCQDMEIAQSRIPLSLSATNKYITYSVTFLDESKNEIKDDFQIPKRSVDDDFSRLWKEGIFSDSILKCEHGGEFQIHKSILSARSEMFAKMFKPETRESQTDIVPCSFDKEVMSSVLEFIYTGNTDVRGKSKEVFVAADYYILPRLKMICKLDIFENMTASNAISTLVFADSFGQESWKSMVLTFIRLNPKEVAKAGEILTIPDIVSKDLLHGIINALTFGL